MFRLYLRSLKNPSYRQFTSRASSNGGLLTKRVAARVTVFTASSLLFAAAVYADNGVVKTIKESSSLGSFVRAYTVYTMCSVPSLVDTSPRLLSFLTSIPGIKQITEAFVRITFFDQFVGGDTVTEALPLLRSLRSANKGVLLAYSVEVDEKEATGSSSISARTDVSTTTPPHKRIVDEMLHSIDVAADLEEELMSKSKSHPSVKGKRTWVAIKMTALLPDARALIALSSFIVESRKKDHRSPAKHAAIPFPGSPRIEDLDVILKMPSAIGQLTPAQVSGVWELYDDLVRICTYARERGIKVIVDAEYSWYQPAIDALTLALMREFNSLDNAKESPGQVQPLVYGTFQAYLRRTPAHLALALADARANNYALGVKLVRGAYHPHEIAAHRAAAANDDAHPSMSISPDVEPPVWMEKRETDEAFNGCLKVLINSVKEDVKRCEEETNEGYVKVLLKMATEDVERSKKAVGHTTVVEKSKKGWFGWFTSRGASNTDIKENESAATEADKELKTTLPAPSIGVLFGTHNWTSCGLILKNLVDAGLAVTSDGQEFKPEAADVVRISDMAVERIAIGQLYGMRDDLTDWVVKNTVSNTPFVIKYVPYGALVDVLPYLSRRAIENKSILGDGAASRERQRAGREIWKRVIG